MTSAASGGSYVRIDPTVYQRLLEQDESNQQHCITIKDVGTYTGLVDSEGKPDRHGSLVYENRNQYGWLKYEGYFKGLPHGYGTLTYKNGDVFQGEMENGIPVSGKITYSNGVSSYEGTLHLNDNGVLSPVTGKYNLGEGSLNYYRGKQVCCLCYPCPEYWGATCPPEKDAKCCCIIC